MVNSKVNFASYAKDVDQGVAGGAMAADMADVVAKTRAREMRRWDAKAEEDVEEAERQVKRALDAWKAKDDGKRPIVGWKTMRTEHEHDEVDTCCAKMVLVVSKKGFRNKDHLDGKYFHVRRKTFEAIQAHLNDVSSAIVGGCGTRGRALRINVRNTNVDVVFGTEEGAVEASKARLRTKDRSPRRWNRCPDEDWPRCRAAMTCEANTWRRFQAVEEARKEGGEVGIDAGVLLSRWALRAGACEGRDALPWDAFHREALRIAAECAKARPNALQVARAAMKGFVERGREAQQSITPREDAAWDRPDGAKARAIKKTDEQQSSCQRATKAVGRTSLLQPCECASPSAVAYTGHLAECGLALLDSQLVAQQAVDVVDAAFGSGKLHPITRFDLLLRVAMPEGDQHMGMNGNGSTRPEAQVCDETEQDALDDVDDPIGEDVEEHHLPDEELTDENLMYDQGVSRAVEDAVEHVVRVALGKRAKIVRAIGRRHAHHRRGAITIGVVLDPTFAFARVEMGPKASQTELAKAFRERHGHRASLRRFANGTVCEAVVWAQKDSERHRCPSRMAKAALRKAFPGIRCAAFGNALDEVLKESALETAVRAGYKRTKPHIEQRETDPREVAFVGDRLSHVLRRIEGLPLRVSGVLMLPPSMLALQAFPARRHRFLGLDNWDDVNLFHSSSSLPRSKRKLRNEEEMIPLCIDPTEVHVVLEGSGRWPAHPEAAVKARSAFLLQIAERLSTDMGIDSISSEDSVDVLFEGYAFRLTLDPQGGHVAATGTDASSFQVRNKHYSALAVLVDKYPEFAPTVRLAKRWIAGHMLSGHINDETVELLVASCFTRPCACQPPATRVSGFCRFLELLSTHPWNSQPLIVDLEAAMTRSFIDTAMIHFDHSRKQHGGPPMCIVLPDDVEGDRWTKSHPSKEVLKKARKLAQATFEKLSGMCNVAEVSTSKWKSLFVSSQACNDVILVLRPEALKAPQQSICSTAALLPKSERASLLQTDFAEPRKQARAAMHMKANRLLQAGKDGVLNALLVGFDPVKRYVSLLRDQYTKFCYIFVDEYGGCTIGIKWKAEVFPPRQGSEASKPPGTSTGGVNGETDVSELVLEMLALGEGLVKGAFVL